MVNNLTLAIEQRLRTAGFCGSVEIDKQAAFISLMAKWNRKINLTSLPLEPVTDEAIDRLIIEPVVASSYVVDEPRKVIDLGTGGGSPAIPFRIQLENASMTMVESRNKKCAFLRECVRSLELANTTVEEARFEEVSRNKALEGAFDLLTVRAVRVDAEFISLVRFLLTSAGKIFRFTTKAEAEAPMDASLVVEATHPLVESSGSILQVMSLR